jgi:nucleotide-binding universal stress UspA family protein
VDAAGRERVVVGLDGSPQSVEALRLAARIAPGLGAAITAVGAWEYPEEYAGYVPLGSDNFAELTQKRMDNAIAEAFGADVPEGFERKVVFGRPSKVLIREGNDASLLVVGRRGHGGFRGLLLGSVSAAWETHAACPVLVIHDGPAKR